MQNLDDNALLREYVECNSEEAFTTLVSRHVNKVYSVAMRHTGNAAQAEEITHAVFVILARKSRALRKGVILSGWLYHTARLTSVTFIRSEIRRARRQQEAYMQSVSNESSADVWPLIAPLLDAAIANLNDQDRHAVVLRFFDQKSMKEVGEAMGATEDAAKKRVVRAVEKLRKYFSKRGVNSTTAIIAGAISANSVQVAPPGLAKTAALIAVSKSAATAGSTLTLIKGALNVMAWTKAKTVIIVSTGILLATGTSTVVVERVIAKSHSTSDEPAWANDPRNWELNSRLIDTLPQAFILRPTRFANNGGEVADNNRQVLRNVAVQRLIADAYSFRDTRIIFPPGLPPAQFDLMLTMPDHPKELLQQEIRKRFGLVAHKETREVDIFRLKVENPYPPNLKRNNHRNESGTWDGTTGKVRLRNIPFDSFIGSIESNMGRPVLDETELTGGYDLDLRWQPSPGESEKDAYRRALSEQLGLELVPDRAPIELLVVEKAH